MKTFKEQLSGNDHNPTVEESPDIQSTLSVSAKPQKHSEKSGFRGQGEQFQPFPVEFLPKPIRDFVVANALAFNCNVAFLVLPVLATLAASIGNSRKIRLKRSWLEPAIIWAVIVANSGTRKSPPIDAGVKPLRDRQSKALKIHSEQMVEHEQAMAAYNAALRKPRGGEPPQRPHEPVAERFVVSDLTIEALAFLLAQQPRGLLVCRDELDGWISGFDQYKGGSGSDAANWLELHGGRSLTVDRRTGTPKTLHIARASCSLVGGIQPRILTAKLTSAHVASGLMARMLFAFPPPRPSRWTDADVDQCVIDRYVRIVEILSDIQFVPGDNGELMPGLVDLSPDAKHRFAQFVNEYGAENADVDEALTASFAKLEGYAARFALVLHLTRWAAGEQVDPNICDLASIEAGVALSRWFTNEARRVHGLLTETGGELERRKLIDWIHRHGGRTTASDLSTGSRHYQPVEKAETALRELVDDELGHWHPIQTTDKGGRPSRMFILSGVSETLSGTEETRGFADTDDEERPLFILAGAGEVIDFDGLNALDEGNTK